MVCADSLESLCQDDITGWFLDMGTDQLLATPAMPSAAALAVYSRRLALAVRNAIFVDRLDGFCTRFEWPHWPALAFESTRHAVKYVVMCSAPGRWEMAAWAPTSQASQLEQCKTLALPADCVSRRCVVVGGGGRLGDGWRVFLFAIPGDQVPP